MPTKFISLFLLLLSFLGFSQTYTVEGIVKDQAYIPIAYANIILEDAENEDLLLGTTTDEQGFFKFNDVKPKVII
ncbi:hypothetical protein JCM19301_2247 [Jejuia pallidilutea]|uniref:TonB-dependent receptor n=1 Tax=Jejuia pallidilutea TaxID=504487 RepID=A0A090WHW6_9FLAO|nr:carboxypeptidase-like regulatory domain-containing protein [Jejuia pallidilutea]GAL67082.1 hypothetical protein JCM19301_2247 [Jejuia pallidilutea]